MDDNSDEPVKMACNGCQRGAPYTGPHDRATQCWLCWLADNDPKYRAAFGLPPKEGLMPRNRSCIKVKQKGPGAVRMAVGLAKSVKEWEAAGKPLRSDDEAKALHLICEGCEYFDAEHDRCKRCGCGLSQDSSVAWIRKLGVPDAIKMATHHCPEGKW